MAIFVVLAMVGLSVFDSNALGSAPSTSGSASSSVVLSSASSVAPWTQPTTSMQEPGYTNGTYIMASTSNVENLNVYLATDVYSFYLLNEIYDSATTLLPNETISPWLATNWTEIPVTSANQGQFLGFKNASSATTVDPLNGATMPVKYVYQVNLRPGVQWTDYAPGTHTYVYGNTTTFNGPHGNSHTVQYRYAPVTMNTYNVQSADFILSWKILQSAYDYSGSFANIVNAVPVSNTTVDFYLSAQSATFLTYSLETPILPFHIWKNHDYSTTPGVWNYTASQTSGGYNNWNVSYNPTTGLAPELVGSGPFMMNGGYGMPHGKWIYNQYWKLYVNPHYWVQYTKSLRQWTPKFYELYVPEYLSLSSAVIALSLNQVYQIEGGVTPTFIPTVATIPHTYIFKKPTTGYGFIQLNSFNQQKANQVQSEYGFSPLSVTPPLNLTSVRQALNYAVNKVYLNSVVDEGYGIPGTSVVPNSDSVWQNGSLPTFSYNPTKAMALLNGTPGMSYANGEFYYNGTQFTMNIQITAAAQNPLGVEAALLIQKWWDGIGVHTTVTQEAFSTVVTNLIGYGFQAIDLGITGVVGDPTGDFASFYTPAGYGSGFFLGPYSSLNATTFPNGPALNGSQVTKEMVKLYNDMNTNTTLSTRIADGNYIQGLAAAESTLINLGYGIDLFPIDNSTFVNTTHDTLGQAAFEYWNFLSVHLKSATVATPPSKTPEQLSVGVVTNKQVYQNGQYFNVTVQVRNQYGSAVSGANVTVGVNPAGALLNLTSLSGVTNAQGMYKLEFQVLNNQPIVYTADYFGQINISAAASMNSAPVGTVLAGLGYTSIDVQPLPVAYQVVKMPALNTTVNTPQPLTVKVYNPVNGQPISHYSLTLQSLAGIVNMTNVTGNGSLSVVQGSPYTTMYAPIDLACSTVPNLAIDQVVGLTNSLGEFTVDVNLSTAVNYSAMGGNNLESYIFLGDYAAGAPVSGATPYMSIAELTSATNPNGFGTAQPVALPIQVTNGTPGYKILLTTNSSYVNNPDGNIYVNVTVETANGNPVPNFKVNLVSQNALGANRGYFSGSGNEIQVSNLNQLFGSLNMPGLEVVTNATGQATAMFNAGLYKVNTQGGSFIGYSAQAFTDQNLMPADVFEISAVGVTHNAVAQTVVNSSQMVNNVAPTPVVAAYLEGAPSVNGVVTIGSGSTYTMFVNSTLNSIAGPSAANVSFTVTVSYGSVSVKSNTTNTDGTYSLSYTAPSVSSLTLVTITVTASNGATYVEHVYVEPAAPSPVMLYALIGVFGALFVVFAAMYAIRVRKPPVPPTN